MWTFFIQYMDWIVGVHGIYTTYLVHYKKSAWGNPNAIFGSLCWILYGFTRDEYGYMPLCILSVVIVAFSMRKERLERI